MKPSMSFLYVSKISSLKNCTAASNCSFNSTPSQSKTASKKNKQLSGFNLRKQLEHLIILSPGTIAIFSLHWELQQTGKISADALMILGQHSFGCSFSAVSLLAAHTILY